MNLKFIYKYFALCLLALTGQSWATVAPELPLHETTRWNAITDIVWKTAGSGDAWGNSALTVGQTVEFKFTLYKEELGTHYADFIKVWVDWSGDGKYDANEVLLFGSNVLSSTYTANNNQTPFVKQSINFTTSLVINEDMLGDNWLLARVTCSESLLTTAKEPNYGDWHTQWNTAYTANKNSEYNSLFSPTDFYSQGQARQINLHVDPSKVPEPGTLALFAVGLAGIGFGRRRSAGS